MTQPNATKGSSAGARLALEVPTWIDALVPHPDAVPTDDDSRMELAIRLSRENIARGGGPFGGVVFLEEQLLALGVNLVLATGQSIAHAEIVALMRAQAALGGDAIGKMPPLTLYASTEPCCQCFGALVWAGVRRLVCGATTEDAESVGFDEGPKPEHWADVLEKRGISVTRGVRRGDAASVLREYTARGGQIYGKPSA